MMNEHSPDRLTKREHEVLQGVLGHKTAKEMALDLGVSHHAVEKRLKRARQKLGAATSLEAARLYRAQYGQSVSGSSELPNNDESISPEISGSRSKRRRFKRRTSMVAVSLLALTGIAALAVTQTDMQASGQNYVHEYEMTMTGVSEEQARSIAFAMLDADRSNGIAKEEFVEGSPNAGVGLKKLQETLFVLLDDDGNGQLDKEEFRSRTVSDENGAPYRLSINAVSDLKESAAKEEPFKYSNRVAIRVPPGEDVYEVAFAQTDADKSGAISLTEFTTLEFASGHPAFKGFEREAALIFDFMDSDDNGLVELEEYATVGFLDDEGNEYLFEISESAQP